MIRKPENLPVIAVFRQGAFGDGVPVGNALLRACFRFTFRLA